MANRFWVGGTGTWDASDTTHWAATSGAAGGASVPGSADAVIFDGSSGGGTVTVGASVSGSTLVGITCGAFTGTLDFTAISALTMASFSATGTGTRTITLGSATYSLTGTNANIWDATVTTGLTLTAGTYTILFTTPSNGNTQTFAGGGLSYATLSVAGRTNGSQVGLSGNNTFANLLIAGPAYVLFPAASTTTITNALSWNGTSANPIEVSGDRTGATLAIASGSVGSWGAFKGLIFTGNSFAATNSFDIGNNVNATITPPSGGGVVGVIGS